MKWISLVVLLAAVFVGTATVTAVTILSGISADMTDIRLEDLEMGRLLPLFLGETMRRHFPSAPHHLLYLLDAYALASATLNVAVVVWLLRTFRGLSLTVAAIVSLGWGWLAYAVGVHALRTGSWSPEDLGGWLSFMLLALLYASAIAAVYCALELCGVRPPRRMATECGWDERPLDRTSSWIDRAIPARPLPPATGP